jgi:hypothetical protein
MDHKEEGWKQKRIIKNDVSLGSERTAEWSDQRR